MAKLKLILDLIKFFKFAVEWFNAFVLKKKQQGELGKLQDAEKKIEEANKIEDDKERLKKKAEAANEIERTIAGN